jgi:hypothetical protein
VWLVILVNVNATRIGMIFIARFCMQSEYGTILQNET